MQTFAAWVTLPENRAAVTAARRAARAAASGAVPPALSPLFLHGPAGVGKSYLAGALTGRAAHARPDLVAAVLGADSFARAEDGAPAPLTEALGADLVVFEDVQRLPPRAAPAVANLLDHLLARRRQVVLTATEGPARLGDLPARLSSRFASGLVVGLRVLSRPSRLDYLKQRAAGRRIALGDGALGWLAANLPGSGRQLDGGLARAASLARLLGHAPTAADLAEHLRADADAHRATVEGIVRRVGAYYRVTPRDLCGPGRGAVLLPRQVGMYLARRLTGLSLQQIGAAFGGRDHSTVLHACRKVEQALSRDAALSAAVRQLHADLA
jgi:chromosomal replication initiator protein